MTLRMLCQFSHWPNPKSKLKNRRHLAENRAERLFFNTKKERKNKMKKLTCILAVMLMLCLCTIAYAADLVTLDITALDYQTGKEIIKPKEG